MKIIINASTLSSTGVVQVAVSFINECKKFENQYLVIINKEISKQLILKNFGNNFEFICIDNNPNKILSGLATRLNLFMVSRKWNPDCTFSIFGPSYWTPPNPHLMGYAYPHYVYTESPYFSTINLLEKFKIKIYKKIHKYFFIKNGSFYVSETYDVSKRAMKYLGCKNNQMFTVSNTYNQYFNKHSESVHRSILPQKKKNEFRLLSLCSLAKHKNLEIINLIVPILKTINSQKQIKFILTVDNDQIKRKFTAEAQKSIINLGRIDVSECPQIYKECDALFLPTLLECFTANYPESMIMEKPIITSNLSFATEICKNSALYFDPLDPADIAQKIDLVASNKHIRELMINNGKKIIKNFPSSEDRARQYLEICKIISQEPT